MSRFSKLLSIFLITFLTLQPGNALAVSVTVNGAQLNCDPPPFIQDGTTLVPMRAIFEALGAQVGWDAETQLVTATKENRVVILQIGKPTGYINNQPVTLLKAPRIVEGRTFVPLRFVSEALGANVDWVAAAQQILINYTQQSKPIINETPQDPNTPPVVVITPQDIKF
ncbi:MAG: copper amine oxidase N-terminal domain-containing protein [Syntrophothermus sp.]|uniref:copper amine oxidase N-terminal domain-containing protein n=1 Tax=Syntrophothermus sp. TaxID=2736299 RepID=UPI0025808ADC|nr:copper amine oxidase N-terminal domain-containing protein [Syntrophothermus sp.]NSW83619.1 copper amine oxidase N-terminal domain-containing protein [Syntrophothermus sp.]